jgi:hypothetical protein
MKWLMWKLFGIRNWICPLCGGVEKVTWIDTPKAKGTYVKHICKSSL